MRLNVPILKADGRKWVKESAVCSDDGHSQRNFATTPPIPVCALVSPPLTQGRPWRVPHRDAYHCPNSPTNSNLPRHRTIPSGTQKQSDYTPRPSRLGCPPCGQIPNFSLIMAAKQAFTVHYGKAGLPDLFFIHLLDFLDSLVPLLLLAKKRLLVIGVFCFGL